MRWLDAGISECLLGTLVLAGVAAALCIFIAPKDFSAQPTEPRTGIAPVPVKAVATSKPLVLGAKQMNCLSANCHGSTDTAQTPLWQHAGHIQRNQDPHSRAFDILYTKRSQEMVARLSDPQLLDAKAHLVLDPDTYLEVLKDRCVTCHATTLRSENASSFVDVAEGVSCEACHGPASLWQERHLEAGWKRMPNGEKRSLGWAHLDSPVAIGAACVQCHVGGPERAVNHDLIAAGHPRLDFELSAWLDAMPKHWSPRAWSHSDLWAAGQIESTRAKALQVASSAERGVLDFAHFDCSACHHALDASPLQHSSGRLTFGGMYWLAKDSAVKEGELTSVLSDVEAVLIRGAEAAALPEAAGRLEARPMSCDSMIELLQGSRNSITSWDQFLAWYYCAAAATRDLKTGSPGKGCEELDRSFTALQEIVRGFLSNAGGCNRYASPSGFRIAQLQTEIDDFVAALKVCQASN